MIKEYIIRVDTGDHSDIARWVETSVQTLTDIVDPLKADIQFYTKELKTPKRKFKIFDGGISKKTMGER